MENILKMELFENDGVKNSLAEFPLEHKFKATADCYVLTFLRRCVDRKDLMRFQSKTCFQISLAWCGLSKEDRGVLSRHKVFTVQVLIKYTYI